MGQRITVSHLSSNSRYPLSEYERPSPPRLPEHLQEEFEELQRQAETSSVANVAADGRELHPDMRQPLQAEFTGDRNPITGEIGGPKTEPTKHGDWSYGGRVSDF
jgi:hypothetical protein